MSVEFGVPEWLPSAGDDIDSLRFPELTDNGGGRGRGRGG